MSRKRAALAAAVAVVAGLVAWVPGATGAQQDGFETTMVDVAVRDGVTLRTMVMEPRAAGPHPLAVLISAWGGGVTQNIMPAKKLAEKGYTVLSYGTRGFGESGGEVQVAGQADIDDVSDVIDWGLANTASDPARVGVAGVSYGAGIGVLASGNDPRIKAVVSMSGWSDLVRSLSTNDTRHQLTALVLHLSGKMNGRLSPEADKMLASIYDPKLTPEMDAAVKAWAQPRSPVNHIAEINRNKPAALFLQTWSETVFEPGQIADLYTALTGPKRMELLPGDHAATESGGLLGLPSGVWDSVDRWFDAYVAGTDTSIAAEPPVQVYPRPGTQKPEGRRDWASAQGQASSKLFLGPKPGGFLAGNAQLGATPPAAEFTTQVNNNRDTVANGGIPLVTYTLEALSGNPPTAMLQLFDQGSGAIWYGPKAATTQKVRGDITAHLTVVPPKAQGTVVAYVYDVDQLGTGKLINYVPYTWNGKTPGQALPLDLVFTPTAYDVAAGHRLAFAVDTKDALFIDKNTDGGKIGFRSSPADPSWIDVPLAR
ncbi:CocE/NonD family hydrolase [Actinokineospora bangkokensis]|uniref:Xaa-Pro dipeptidyl-peptidase C-terminal domain-containing protein n=1 Tax=Actinokineospora bangkokensis TaxID=1193682 RepID=A0A1Q9LIB5_9PSEU|nr:CocE/NonD family hydrolase [Actinokineospora bangkokensis]OLR91750.1 hypothetical protein BJP25_24805 [Actinokineospora bangkokensis]